MNRLKQLRVKGYLCLALMLALVLVTISCTSTSSTTAKAPAATSAATATTAAASTTTVKPSTSALATSTAAPAAGQTPTGGVFKILIKNQANRFGYPPTIVGPDRDFAPPFFNRLIGIGNDGKYQPELALSWDSSADGKTITFKLRQGVKFQDGTDFNAAAVKANLDKLLPPGSTILTGVTSINAPDDYTVNVNLADFNNLILYQLASSFACYMYSPTALQKNGADWAAVNPVGTGPFILKEFVKNTSVSYVRNPNYWEKGLPYLAGMEMNTVADPTTQVIAMKAGQANAIYDAQPASVSQLKAAGFLVVSGTGSTTMLSFDSKNSEYFSKLEVRQAMEYAIDKETISTSMGEGVYKPSYQLVYETSADYNTACPPRKYDVNKARQLLAAAGYPNGFSFKAYILDSAWKDSYVAIQSYLDKVGIKMDINYINAAAYANIRTAGKIDKGAAAHCTMEAISNNIYILDTYFRSDSLFYQYVVRPAATDALINQAKAAKDPAAASKIDQQIIKSLYDDATVLPLFTSFRTAIVDKTVQDSGWFVNNDSSNNKFGTGTQLKK